MANYGNEHAEPRDIAKVENPVTKQNADDAYDQLMFIKVVSMLLANQDCNEEGISVERSRDLGRLFFFLAGQPSDVLSALSDAFNDDDDGPDPGKERPVLTPIETTNQAVIGGAK